MTIRAEKFRIRRTASAALAASRAAAMAEDAAPRRVGAEPDAPPPAHLSGAVPSEFAAVVADAAIASPAEAGAEDEIETIRAEGLTGRHLRMARRVAQRHGIEATSDFDAVRLLRQRGIDPFQAGNVLELVVGADGFAAEPADDARPVGPVATATAAQSDPRPAPEPQPRPQTVPGTGSGPSAPTTPPKGQALARPIQTAPAPPRPQAAAPSPGILSEEDRAREVRKIQRDIARRRRRKLLALAARLMVFVMLPTILAGHYFYNIATPMYGTKSEFVIQQADSGGGGRGGGLGSLLGGGMGAQQDSITVQGYLNSREALLRLEADHGFKQTFAQEHIDPLQRLSPDASNEEAYRLYQRNVKIAFDPTEGILKMEVIAPDPELSATFSRALIAYAEEQVDTLTQRVREDQMQGARESYLDAEEAVRRAQARVIALQEQRGVLSADAEVGALMGRISEMEGQILQERLQLDQFLSNPQPNAIRVQQSESTIARLEVLVAELRQQMTNDGADENSLARITGELRIAEAELETRQALLAASLEQQETARIEANRQVRYLSVAVSPIPPDEPTYPRAFENTAVSFLVFAGIYLMISLTASILREQVSS